MLRHQTGAVLIREGEPLKGRDGNWRVDSYGYVVCSARRGTGCRCKEPCQAYFVCMSSHHRGPRETPFCCGCADDEEIETGIEVCDRCWCTREKNRAKRRAA